jgi:ArsR family transcriptional regulator
MSDSARLAAMFKALGDPTRLQIFTFLRACCGPVAIEETGDVRPVLGASVGEVCCQVTGSDRITSTISFHLKELRQAGLIRMERRGKQMICAIRSEGIAELIAYLQPSLPDVESDGCAVHASSPLERSSAERG